MPATEAQKRAMKKYREKNREKVNKLNNESYHRWRAKLNALQQAVNELSQANGIEPIDCSKLPGAPTNPEGATDSEESD